MTCWRSELGSLSLYGKPLTNWTISLRCGVAVVCTLPRRTQKSQSLPYSNSSLWSSVSIRLSAKHGSLLHVLAGLSPCVSRAVFTRTLKPRTNRSVGPKERQPSRGAGSRPGSGVRVSIHPSLCARSLWMILEYWQLRPSPPHLELCSKEWHLKACFVSRPRPQPSLPGAWSNALIMPKECFRIVLLLIPKNGKEPSHGSGSRPGPGVKNSKFNRSPSEWEILCSPFLHGKRSVFPSAKAADVSVLLPTGLLFYSGQGIIFPIIIGIKQKPFERESCV